MNQDARYKKRPNCKQSRPVSQGGGAVFPKEVKPCSPRGPCLGLAFPVLKGLAFRPALDPTPFGRLYLSSGTPAPGALLSKCQAPDCTGVALETASAFAGEFPSHAGFPAGGVPLPKGLLSGAPGCFLGMAPPSLVKVYHMWAFPAGGIPLPKGLAFGAPGCFLGAAPLLLVRVCHTPGFPPGYPAPKGVALGGP